MRPPISRGQPRRCWTRRAGDIELSPEFLGALALQPFLLNLALLVHKSGRFCRVKRRRREKIVRARPGKNHPVAAVDPMREREELSKRILEPVIRLVLPFVLLALAAPIESKGSVASPISHNFQRQR